MVNSDRRKAAGGNGISNNRANRHLAMIKPARGVVPGVMLLILASKKFAESWHLRKPSYQHQHPQ